MTRRILTAVLLGAAAFILIYFLQKWFQVGAAIYMVDDPGNAARCSGESRFAVIGDYGQSGRPAAEVAALVSSWHPEFIVTVGDNNYNHGEARTIDENIGRYYSAYIHPYLGAYGPGSDANRFFPALGNHDWLTDNARPYLDYFTLPGNERYYDVRQGDVHLFVLDSNPYEPDGRTPDSLQAQWLQDRLAASDATWKLVVLHHAPYSSGLQHGDVVDMQWDYAAMGAAAVLAGHEHFYERLTINGIPYITNGLGGRQRIYRFADPPREGSAVRYNQEYGALLVTVGPACLNFSFFDIQGTLIDSHTLQR